MKMLKRFRLQSGETQSEFASRAGLPQQAISDLETGRKTTTPERLARVLRAAMSIYPPAQGNDSTRRLVRLQEEVVAIRRLLDAVIVELEAGGDVALLRQTAEAAFERHIEIRDDLIGHVLARKR